MSNERDKLADDIVSAIEDLGGFIAWTDDAPGGLAEKLTAAGWRPPARTITTVEELEALPSGAVILDSSGEPNVLHDNGWVLPGGPGGYTTWAVAQSLPATVLHEAVTP